MKSSKQQQRKRNKVNRVTSSISIDVSRREFVTAVGAVTGGMALGLPKLRAASLRNVGGTVLTEKSEAPIKNVSVEMVINGESHRISLDPRVTLLDLLRENLGLTGTKKGCDHGQCGACTVLVNGRRINSCLALAVGHEGDEITTIEGLASGSELHPLQTAFVEEDGLQCGYCTPGQICSAVALLREAQNGDLSFVTKDFNRTGPAHLSADEIRERMSGNICRCGAYPGIVAAVQAVASRARSSERGGGAA